MDIYEITKRDLRDRNFAFRDETEFLGKDFRNQPFIFDGLLVNICTKGTARIKIDYIEYRVSANDMLIILPRHICSILECSVDFEIRIILVSLEFTCSLQLTPDFDLLKRVEIEPCVHLDKCQLEDMLKIHSIITRHNGNDELSRQIQDTLIRSILLLTVSSFGKTGQTAGKARSRQETMTVNFFSLLIGSGGKERKVSHYADKLCISPKHLTTVVKQVTGHSAQSWINEVAVIEARRHLKTTDMTIRQISDKMHFQSSSSFVRFFRKHTGTTPLKYREKGI
mgnify:CR=1 FL=1